MTHNHKGNVPDQFAQTMFSSEISLKCLYLHLGRITISDGNHHLIPTQRALLVPPISSSAGTDAVSVREKCVMKSTTAETERMNSRITTVVS